MASAVSVEKESAPLLQNHVFLTEAFADRTVNVFFREIIFTNISRRDVTKQSAVCLLTTDEVPPPSTPLTPEPSVSSSRSNRIRCFVRR